MKILLDGYFDKNLGDDLMLTIAANALSGHDLYINSGKLRIDGARTAVKKSGYDVYLKVTGSGFRIYNRRGCMYRARDILREKRCAKMHAAIGCSIDDFPFREAEYIIKKQISYMNLITVRDRKSFEYIRKNIPLVSCAVYPDMVFSLPEETIPNEKCRGFLGIAVRAGINIPETATAADRFIKETGRGILLLAFDAGEENDTLTAKEIYSEMKYKEKADISVYASIRSTLRDMRSCSLIWGARLHSVILSARMGIPFVPLLPSDKLNGVLDSINYRGGVCSERDSAETLIRLSQRAADFKLFPSVIADAKGHMTDLKKLLGTAEE